MNGLSTLSLAHIDGNTPMGGNLLKHRRRGDLPGLGPCCPRGAGSLGLHKNNRR